MIRTGAVFFTPLVVLGCMAQQPPARTAAPEESPEQTQRDEEIALEELEMEDAEALSLLIAGKLASAGERRHAPETGADVVDASGNWRLKPAECLERLEGDGIRFGRPAFETPGVETPLLLDGPIGGVAIEPRWPRSGNVNAVIDCHLMLALVEVARQAKALGVKKLLYYSVYRPAGALPGHCAEGPPGARCRRLSEAYRRSRKSPSQHRAALAIDIGWLITEDDELVDLSEHFDRRPGTDPCSYEPGDDKARLLTDLACALYREGVFNVMLTPNANRAHHNHFHFDITPGADWYIIR